MQRNLLKCAVFLILLASAACARSGKNSAPLLFGSGIFGGSPVQANSPLRRGIVAISYNENGQMRVCTGVLIGPQTALTSAHCIGDGAGSMRIYFFLTRLSLYDFEHSEAAYVRTVKSAWPAPGFLAIHQQDPNVPNPYDLAVLRLNQTAPPQTSAFYVSPNSSLISAGQRAFVAGYGYEAYYPASQRSVGSMSFRYTTQDLLPPQPGLDLLRLDGSHGAGTCKGDSGGPVYLESANSGPYILVGLLAGTMFPAGSPETCHHTTTAVEVAPLSGWILQLLR